MISCKIYTTSNEVNDCAFQGLEHARESTNALRNVIYSDKNQDIIYVDKNQDII